MSSDSRLLAFLNGVLAARGSQALPYKEDLKWNIRDHLMQLISHFPSLSPSNAHFTHNDGRAAHLLRVQGTLPIYYQSVKYNIPVCFWLPEAYPRCAPLCFVTPTPEMVVKPGHSVVDASGLARQLPYLQRWTFPSHNLVDCTRALADAFSRDPPLFAKPTASQQQQQLQQQQQQQQRPAGPDPRWTEMLREQEAVVAAATASAASAASGGYGAAQSGAGTVRYNQHYSTPPMPMAGGGAVQPQPSAYAAPLPMYAPQQGIAAQPPPPQRSAPPPPPPPLPPVESPEAAFRSRALASLRASARAALSAAAADSAERVTALLEEQSRLEVRRSALQAQLSPLRLEREALESHVSSLDASTVAVEAWLAENVARVPEDLSADAALAPRDAWQAQALAAAAEDAACEECLYSLAAALEAGKVGLDAYLRLVRQLCREQFMARATVLVVKAAQEATQGRG